MPLLGELFFSRLWGVYCSIAMGHQRPENQTKLSRTKRGSLLRLNFFRTIRKFSRIIRGR